MSERRKPGIYLAWRTVTYRSVVLMVLAVLVVFAAALHFAFPQATQSGIEQAAKLTSRLFEAIAGEATPDKINASGSRQAHFTNLEGVVKVKKANSNSWRTADYSLPLEKGDVIQTTSEGMAKVVFNDGTNYTVKQDSLIVIEENAANDKQQTSVAVTVDTGTVDLATGIRSWWHIRPLPSSTSASWRTISSRTGSESACSTVRTSIAARSRPFGMVSIWFICLT